MSYNPSPTLADGSVTATKLADGAVTTAKMGGDVTTLAKDLLQQSTTTDAKDTLDVTDGGGLSGVVVPFTY